MWEPLNRVYIYQRFNLTGEGQLVNDLYQSAVNFTARTGVGLVIDHTSHVYARCVKNNMEMNKALEQETGTGRKSKGAYTCEEQEEYLWIHHLHTSWTRHRRVRSQSDKDTKHSRSL
jgi:hypothetical protein